MHLASEIGNKGRLELSRQRIIICGVCCVPLDGNDEPQIGFSSWRLLRTII